MNKRDFNAKLKRLSTKYLLDKAKVIQISDAEKEELMFFVVRHREPLIVDFVPKQFSGAMGQSYTPESWLASMGYLRKKQGSRFTFWVTCENEHKVG